MYSENSFNRLFSFYSQDIIKKKVDIGVSKVDIHGQKVDIEQKLELCLSFYSLSHNTLPIQ